MIIGEVAKASGVSVKTIRYYEEIGLISPQRSQSNQYRIYNEKHIHILKFLNRARNLGFSIHQCRDLLSLYEDQKRASADVKNIAKIHLDEIRQKINQLEEMHGTLSLLVNTCQGDDRPDCPILSGLAGQHEQEDK